MIADFHMMGDLERMVLEDMHRWLAKDGKVLVFEEQNAVGADTFGDFLKKRTVPYKKAVESYWKEKI